MKNLKLLFIAFCLFGFGLTEAQEVIATGGDFHSNANGSMSITIGEPIGETLIGSENTLTQGFQQSKYTISIIRELPGLDYTISAYPNPTKDFVKLKVENSKDEIFRYELYDLSGKLLQQKNFESQKEGISFSNLPPTTYIVKVYDEQKVVKSFKIIKH